MKPNKVTFSKDMKNDVPTTLLIFLCQWVFIMLFLPCCASASCDQVDRDALLSLDFKASSPLNWSASSDCCLWEGILCGPDDRVLHLWLPGRGLSGSVSPAITNLTYLTHLNLSQNTLLGVLPDGLFSSLFHLQVLDLSFNRLNGHLPVSSNEASKLQIVDLSSNYFNGTIPSVASGSLSIFNVSKNSFAGSIPISVFCKNGSNHNNLTFMDFSFNRFTDPIPTGLASCSKLQIFRAGFNALSGHLPDDIFGLADLQQLSLPVNRLSGPIGNGIVGLTNLKILELYSNQLVGDIPSQIGNLVRLEKLVLHSNNLTGAIPPSLNNCTNLSTLNLRVNNLTGELSAFNFSTFQLLTTLDLGNNNFTGKLPQSLYSCKSLTAIRLASNNLQGQILPEIVALESLAFLSISNNNLTNATGAFMVLMGCKNLTTLVLTKSFLLETLPNDESLADLDGFHKLQVLAIGGCKFTGQVPTWIAKLKSLQVLDLAFNLITGSIPGWLGSLPKLFYMDLSNNLLTGGFPEELCRMPSLTSKEADDKVERSYLELPVSVMSRNGTDQQYNHFSQLPPTLYLGWNSLSGNIPIEIGQLKFLHELDLSHNNFSGSIPVQISNLSNLEKLDLSYNHLSGAIPASLTALNFLSFFSIAYNDLQGFVPSGGQFSTFTISSFEGNPRLCGYQTAQQSCSLSPPSPPVFAGTQRSSNKILTALIFGITFSIFLV
ncbi:receptor-like protein 3 [Rosa sericea]